MPEGTEEASKGEIVFSAGEHAEEPITGLLLSEIRDLEESILKGLKQTGYKTAQEVLRLPAVDLSKIVGLDESQAVKVLETIAAALEKQEKK
jgi:hypothetical protein